MIILMNLRSNENYRYIFKALQGVLVLHHSTCTGRTISDDLHYRFLGPDYIPSNTSLVVPLPLSTKPMPPFATQSSGLSPRQTQQPLNHLYQSPMICCPASTQSHTCHNTSSTLCRVTHPRLVRTS